MQIIVHAQYLRNRAGSWLNLCRLRSLKKIFTITNHLQPEIFTQRLEPFIPGTLHNAAVGSAHIQPKLPP